jgi:hypothetical protein
MYHSRSVRRGTILYSLIQRSLLKSGRRVFFPKKYKRTGLPSYFIEFKNPRRDVKRKIDVAFRDCISKLRENLVRDLKNFWSFVNNRKGSRMSNGGHSLS